MSRKAAYQRARRSRLKELRGGGSTGTTAPSQEQTSALKTYDTSGRESRFSLEDADTIGERLQAMAERGEFPEFIAPASREVRERFYEEFDRVYPDPPGILNDYRVRQTATSAMQVSFNYDLAEAESPPQIALPRRYDKMNESVKRGIIKHAIYSQRPAVELALLSRSDGYASFPIAEKYGKRVLSTAERAAADKEMIAHVERLLGGTHLTKEGLAANSSEWRSMNGGWRRVGTISGEELEH